MQGARTVVVDGDEIRSQASFIEMLDEELLEGQAPAKSTGSAVKKRATVIAHGSTATNLDRYMKEAKYAR